MVNRFNAVFSPLGRTVNVFENVCRSGGMQHQGSDYSKRDEREGAHTGV